MTTRRMFARILPFLAPLPMLTKTKAVESVAAPLDAGFINSFDARDWAPDRCYESFDARDWAKSFAAHVREKPTIASTKKP